MTHDERIFRQRWGYHCEPTTIAMASLAISAAGTAASIQGQKQQAAAQAKQQQDLTAANNFVAGEQMSQLRVQEAQQRESAARENERARLAAQKARSSSVVAAGEAGVAGNSVDALLAEHAMQLGQFREATARQSQLNAMGITAQAEAIRTGARFQNLSINAPISGPNYGAEFARFGANTLGTYKDYKSGAFGATKTSRA